MLVLTRKTRQQVKIGSDITITILMVKGQTVRVGIEAPRQVRVLRAELPSHENDRPTTRELVAEVVELEQATVEQEADAALAVSPSRSVLRQRLSAMPSPKARGMSHPDRAESGPSRPTMASAMAARRARGPVFAALAR
jgi:carbon storage regulator CsrA